MKKIDGSGTAETVTISNINTAHAIASTISFSSNGGQLAGMIAASINRGVLATPPQWGTNAGATPFPSKYYLRTDNQDNLYAKTLSSFAIDKKIYATPYDDNWNMHSGFMPIPNSTPVTITILPLT